MRAPLRNLVVLGGVTAAAIAFGVLADRARKPPSVVDVVPQNAAMVLELDLTELRRTVRGRAALDSITHRALDARASCAIELFGKLERLGVAIPAGSGFEGDVVIVGVGAALRATDVTLCAQGVVRARSGEPRLGRLGSFVTVQDGGGERGVLAVRDGGPILIGHGAWLDAVIDVADAATPSLRGDRVHDDARRAQKGSFATLTYALPEDLRLALSSQLPKGAESLARVPSLVAALRLDEVSGNLVLDADARCAGSTCDELAKWLSGARELFSHDPRVTLLGVRDELDHATIVAAGDRVRISLQIPIDRVEAIWRELEGGAPMPPPSLPSGHPSSAAIGPIGSTSASAPN